MTSSSSESQQCAGWLRAVQISNPRPNDSILVFQLFICSRGDAATVNSVLRDTTSAVQPTCRNLDTITIGTIFEFTLVFFLVGLTNWKLLNDEYRLTITLTGTIARVDGTSKYLTFKLQWLQAPCRQQVDRCQTRLVFRGKE
jgi:hypothetical protein